MPVGVTVLSGVEAFDADGDNWKVTFEVLQDSPFAVSHPINYILVRQEHTVCIDMYM